jgi:RND family efflux transporter MFP subunit
MKEYSLSLVPVFLALSACSHAEKAKQSEAAPAAPVRVRTVEVKLTDWSEPHEVVGTVRARKTATVASRLMGYVQEVKVQVGDRVEAGQLLITLEVRDLEASRRRAEAGRNEAQQAMAEVSQAITAAKANLDLAQKTFTRFQDLYQRKSVSQQEFDEASTRLEAARANYEMARARRSQAEAKLAQVDQEIQSVDVNLAYAGLKAPFAGVVTERRVEPGNLAAPGQPLLMIDQADAYRLEAQVEESRISSVGIGQGVKVVLDALNQSSGGRVSEIVPAVDASSRAFTVKIDLPAIASLRAGMFGRAQFPQSARQVLTVPSAAVIENGQLQSVMVAAQGVARNRLVTLGRRASGRAEVLSGLEAGEQIVFPVLPALADGGRIEVQ